MMNKFTGVIGSDRRSVTSNWSNGSRRRADREVTPDADPSASLPDWSELEAPENKRLVQSSREPGGLAAWPTARMLLWLVAAGLVLTLYVGHVHATKQLLSQVHELRQENLQLHLKYNRLRGDLQEAAGPTTVYERARRLGLQEGHSYGPTIYLGE